MPKGNSRKQIAVTKMQFAEDLRRFVNRQGIVAKRVSFLGKGVRWYKRNRSLSTVTALLVISLCLCMSGFIWQRFQQQESWEPIPKKYSDLFHFDRTKPWNAIGVERATFQGREVQRVSFDAGYGDQRITCYVLLPDRKYKPPYQVMLGTSPIVEGDIGLPRIGDQRFRHYSPLSGGRALVLRTLWGNPYDRPGTDFEPRIPSQQSPEDYTRNVVKMVQDLIRTVDFLNDEYNELANPEEQLDMGKLIFVSCNCFQSECMIVADKLVSGNNRFAAAFLALGGIHNQDQPPDVDQLTYLPHIDTPTVILNRKGYLPQPYECRRARRSTGCHSADSK